MTQKNDAAGPVHCTVMALCYGHFIAPLKFTRTWQLVCSVLTSSPALLGPQGLVGSPGPWPRPSLAEVSVCHPLPMSAPRGKPTGELVRSVPSFVHTPL